MKQSSDEPEPVIRLIRLEEQFEIEQSRAGALRAVRNELAAVLMQTGEGANEPITTE